MHPAIIRRMHMALYVLGTLPLTALLTALVLPGRMEVLWLFSAAALILLFFLPPEGKNKRGIWAILACVLTGCMGLALLPWQQNRLTLLVPFAVMLLLLIPPFRQRGEYMSYAFRAFGLIAFLVCFVASRLPSPEPFFTLAQTHLPLSPIPSLTLQVSPSPSGLPFRAFWTPPGTRSCARCFP